MKIVNFLNAPWIKSLLYQKNSVQVVNIDLNETQVSIEVDLKRFAYFAISLTDQLNSRLFQVQKKQSIILYLNQMVTFGHIKPCRSVTTLHCIGLKQFKTKVIFVNLIVLFDQIDELVAHQNILWRMRQALGLEKSQIFIIKLQIVLGLIEFIRD
ncbi:hypothetical protein BpHYR1_001651 [Brachionus plicatilis]|uniref:Uncharacterized protein n=1 Tax=Brachionus plicatilis TaxID=10195 RepID=A0A3M7SXP2_BRAPC|nr:hypothetical protein BpHYR1_001651 [Brachionus plicatilis]